MDKFDFENLVFEGGGVKGIAYGGVVKYLEENGLVSQIKRLSGASAGAIVVGALAIGYSAQEIIDILWNKDFNDFKDDTPGLIVGNLCDLYRVFNQYGLYKGEEFYNWFRDLVKQKTGNGDITLKEVYDTYDIEVVITGTFLNLGKVEYYHYTTHPDLTLATAVRRSMSIPGMFACCERESEEGTDIIVDGGTLCNYPISVFDGDDIGHHETFVCPEDCKTIGFKLMTPDEEQNDQIYTSRQPINNIMDYLIALISSLTMQIERLYVEPGYWERTVCINTHNVKTTDFDITNEEKQLLIDEGYACTKAFFEAPVDKSTATMSEITGLLNENPHLIDKVATYLRSM